MRFLHTLRLDYANCDRFVTQQNGPYNPIFGPFLPKKIHEKGSQFEQQVILFATEQFSTLKLKQLKCYKIPKLPKSRFRAGPPFCDTDLIEIELTLPYALSNMSLTSVLVSTSKQYFMPE